MPENTLPAFAAALALGADEIEFDVRLTKDEQMIVSHDGTLDRISDGVGNLNDFSLQELKRLNVGVNCGWIVTFCTQEEVFEGIKLHPVCHKYSLEEYGDKVFSFADKYSAVVQIHPEKGADYIIPFADRYTKTRFIMAHLGNENHINAVRKAKYGNVYADTSGMASLKNMIIEYAVSQIGSERILFGTDTYSAASQRGRIEFSMISDRDKENILFNNAKELFGL